MLQIYETFVTSTNKSALKCVNCFNFNILRMFRNKYTYYKKNKIYDRIVKNVCDKTFISRQLIREGDNHIGMYDN